jgi:hypothetical protein
VPTIHHPYILAAGVAALVIGWLLTRWAGRHDFKSLAVDAAWTAARTRGKSAMTPEIRAKLDAVTDGSKLQRGKAAAGMAARHVVAQVANIAGIGAILAGLAGVAAGIWMK